MKTRIIIQIENLDEILAPKYSQTLELEVGKKDDVLVIEKIYETIEDLIYDVQNHGRDKNN